MKNVLNFDSWKNLNEAAGVSPAVFKALNDFFEKNPDGSYDEAKKYVATQVKDWELSKEDYEEAKK
jgi:hypothetical protein